MVRTCYMKSCIFFSLAAPSFSSQVTSKRAQIFKISRSSPQTIPVFQGYGAYYLDLYVGSPPQRQTFMIDTGSEHIAIPCTGCKDCGKAQHTDAPFHPSASLTFKDLSCSECLGGTCSLDRDACHIGSKYIEGSSWSGTEVEDVIYPGGFHNDVLNTNTPIRDDDDVYSGAIPINALKYAFHLKFACMESNEGEFKKQKADGIIGLNMNKGSFWKQMWNSGAMVVPQFSMCIRKHPFSSLKKSDSPIGTLTLGGIDDRLQSSEMVFMDLDQTRKSSFYQVHISRIFVIPGGGQRLRGDAPDLDLGATLLVEDDEPMLNRKGVILDSGTTDTILPAELKPSFDRAWMDIMGFPFPEQDVEVSSKELRKWPTIVFEMKGGQENSFIAFPSSSYMSLSVLTGRYVPSLWMHDKFGTSILGSNFMRSHNVLFDMENYQIGMAESNCDYQALITGIETDFADPYSSIKEVQHMLKREKIESICEENSFTCKVFFAMRLIVHVCWISLVALIFLELKSRFNQTVEDGESKLTRNTSHNDCQILEHEGLTARCSLIEDGKYEM